VKLAIDPPQDNMLIDLAPRVQVIHRWLDRSHQWGYALSLTSLEKVCVLFDEDGKVEEIPCECLLFKL
jgi:hypothetical protein